MLPRTSRSPALPAERPVLANPWVIALLAGLVGGVLWLMYPRQDLERRIAESSQKDATLSLAYLRNLLRSDPDNPRLKTLMAEHLASEASLREAAQAQEAVRKAAGPEQQEAWMRWNASLDAYYALAAEDVAQRSAMRPRLVAQLQTLIAADLPLGVLPTLADQASALGEPTQAALLYNRIADSAASSDQAERYYLRAAKETLASADHVRAAQLLMKAKRLAGDPVLAKTYYLQAVATMQASGKAAKALSLAQQELGDLDRDPEVLQVLVELARAAGQPAVAQQYMKQLLKLALLRQWESMASAAQWSTEGLAALSPAGFQRQEQVPVTPPLMRQATWQPVNDPVLRVRTAAGEERPGPGLPFDDKIYSLGYQVFLENRNVEDAWRVARSAVQQAPDHLVWRERLAQVSEWTGRPALALENWLAIARTTQKDEAWQAVLRLAPGLFQDEALVEGLRYELRRQPHNARLAEELVVAYERLGTPRPAIEFLKQQQPTPATLELLANVAERSGDLEQALDAWTTLFQDPAQATPARAMRAATLAVVRNQPSLAMQWLEAAHTRINEDEPEAADFWRMTGQLAQRQQRSALALKAFRELIATPSADVADYDSLIRLLQHDEPLQTAEVAALAWERFDLPRHLVLALSIHAGRSQWPAVQQLLKRLDPQPEAKHHAMAPLRQDPEFVRLVGLYQQNTGQMALAGQWLEAGLRLAPDDAAMRQAVIWLLIDSNDHAALRKLLSQYEAQWSQDEDMLDALGTAYQALSRPAIALQRYFTPRLSQHQTDFLWLMNYADALDQNQEADKSWRLRRYLLSLEWQTARGATRAAQGSTAAASLTQATRHTWLTEEGLDTTRRIARARLTITNKPGDQTLAALRELLRLDREANQALSNAAAETALGWLQDAQQYSAERGLLWQQYARSRSLRANRPLWADITLALAEQDKAAAGTLLETFGERLPRYDLINAAVAVQDIRQAQTSAFEIQNDQPDDAPLHLQLTENLLAFSDHAGLRMESRKLGALEEKETSAQWQIEMSPRLSVDLGLSRTQRIAGIPSQLQNPSQEQGMKFALRWRNHDSTTQLRLERRESLATYTPVQLEYEWQIDDRLSLRVDMGLDLPTLESTAMRMAGMADRAGMALRYQFTRRDQFSVEHWQDRFRLQTGGHLGSGRHSSLAYNHSYRLDAPTLEFGAFWSQHDYRRKDPASLTGLDLSYQQYLPPGITAVDSTYFLPNNFRFYGLQVSTNTRFQRDYTRALLPFASVARTWHSSQGAGYNLQLGLSGSVLGADQLSLGWSLIRGGTQTQGHSREIQLRYRLHF